jgi:hypothetical protein
MAPMYLAPAASASSGPVLPAGKRLGRVVVPPGGDRIARARLLLRDSLSTRLGRARPPDTAPSFFEWSRVPWS